MGDADAAGPPLYQHASPASLEELIALMERYRVLRMEPLTGDDRPDPRIEHVTPRLLGVSGVSSDMRNVLAAADAGRGHRRVVAAGTHRAPAPGGQKGARHQSVEIRKSR